ncbi:class I SAM-dependent methyltransferase [Telmatospirillum sp.]|uniref:class I SAM-dependent methyltransferase n=1 Tax=Telmatospirillum sp. TaxID=2079197 RepID=UPI00284CB80A|nr:class I SAM-dependent methyltransferase [Telmatospirillum sp.]MDR3440103.1 class I SAM-dependent methyltransferase [Telmatospirillum sp.]
MREHSQGRIACSAFDNPVRHFDRLRRRLVPRFDDFFGSVLELLEDNLFDERLHFLDLGAGTGLLSELVLDRFPQSTLTAVDVSDSMAEQARLRLARFTDRVRIHIADYTRIPLPSPVDAVISALSIHHLPDDEKRNLFRRVFDALQPGGLFINADQSLGPTPVAEQVYHARWLADVKASALAETELATALERSTRDRNAPMGDQVTWLYEAGFAIADVAWKRYRFTVFWARKS